jgi:5,10-methylenetetrahydromethanopterin reductase
LVRIGVRFMDDLGTPRELIELAVSADRLGFSSVVFPHDTFRYHAWTMTGAVAQATERIHLMPVGTNPWSTDPSEIAAYAATLDLISGGRAMLGLGLHTDEFLRWVGLDVDPASIVPAVRETAAAIRAVWRGGPAPYSGEHVRWSDKAYLRFSPLRADIPIYICPFGPKLLALAGEVGDGALPMCTPPESASMMVDLIRQGATAAGRDAARLDVMGFVWVSCSADGDQARDRMARVISYYGPYLEAGPLATIGLTPADFAPIKARTLKGDRDGAQALVTEQMLQLGVFGTPSEVIRRLETVIGGGVTHVSLGGPMGPDPAGALELLGREVLPYFGP